jgi:hypothetical protein
MQKSDWKGQKKFSETQSVVLLTGEIVVYFNYYQLSIYRNLALCNFQTWNMIEHEVSANWLPGYKFHNHWLHYYNFFDGLENPINDQIAVKGRC